MSDPTRMRPGPGATAGHENGRARTGLGLEVLETPAAVAARAADLLGEVLLANPRAVCLLPAGNTPRPLYAELLRRVADETLDLRSLAAFQLDEVEGLDGSHPASFHAFLRRELLDAVEREPGSDFLLDGAASDPLAEIARHARHLEALGPPDLALLGLGANGHVAFNEPGTGPADGARRVELAPETRAALGGLEATHGLTLGLRELLSARRVVLLVTGAGKRGILERLLATGPTSELPASFFHEHPDAVLLADRAARG